MAKTRPGGRRPILVTGMPRSGTTWVGRALTAGGEVGYLDEPLNLKKTPGMFRIPVENWYVYITPENQERFLPALGDALAFRYRPAHELALCRNRADVRRALNTWRTFVRSRGLRPLVKEPHAVFSAEWFANRLGSDVVIMVRHPLAVVSSWKRLGWNFDFGNLLAQNELMEDQLEPFRQEMEIASARAGDLVDRVALLWRIIYSIVAGWQEHRPAFHIVRQEDLSRETLVEFAKLYEVLGLTFTTEAARAIAASTGNKNLKETPVDNPYETRIDSRANLSSWRDRLTADEILRIRRSTEDTANHYYLNTTWA